VKNDLAGENQRDRADALWAIMIDESAVATFARSLFEKHRLNRIA
jgi:hypothetical protein